MAEDSLSSDAIMENLDTCLVGQKVLYYPSVSSTMDIARQEAQRGASDGAVVIADEQTAGRGRLQRTWLSPKGNVTLSVILRPQLTHMPSLIMLASLAVVHCIRHVTGLEPQIKWPNDVLINGRKVCGILIETDIRGTAVNYAVIGIGINVKLKLADFTEIQATATSLSQELRRDVSRLAVIRSLLIEIDRFYRALATGESLYEEWRDNLVTLGQRVRVTAGKTIYEGVAESVAMDGSLLLRDDGGRLVTIVAGDVTLRT